MPGPQQNYYETLGSLVGRVRAIKPNIPATVAQDFANDRIRTLLDRQPQWSGLWAETIMYVPDPYNTGSVALSRNSKHVTGTSTVWPVNDAVNTSLPDGVIRTGYQVVTPSDMTGITADSYLYVDAAGSPEVVHVIEVRPTSFVAIFEQFHNPGCTVTASSFAGRQFRLGNTFPVFTIEAIVSNTELITDMPWMASDISNSSYLIAQMYYTISPDIKSLLAVLDQAQGIPPLRVDVPILELNRIDPQRSATGFPQIIANRGTNSNGNIQWELWPRCTSERQLRVFYFKQPAKLISEGDRIPAFMNPTVLFHGMMADAYRTKIGPDDAFYNQNLGIDYERRWEEGVLNMMLQDDEKLQNRYSNMGQYIGFGGANFRRYHSVELLDYYGW
jgi:hypothetical protein